MRLANALNSAESDVVGQPCGHARGRTQITRSGAARAATGRRPPRGKSAGSVAPVPARANRGLRSLSPGWRHVFGEGRTGRESLGVMSGCPVSAQFQGGMDVLVQRYAELGGEAANLALEEALVR